MTLNNLKAKAIRLLLIIFFSCLISYISAQKESNIWHIGYNASIDFNTGFPKPYTDTPNSTGWGRGCASICDSSGSLLFYTYGKDIINQNHVRMQNSDGLLGAEWSSQSAVIIPLPKGDNIYYVFTVGGMTTVTGDIKKGLHYSVVDMTLDNGLGGVKVDKKNIKLIDEAYCNLTLAKHNDDENFWIITYNGFNQQYYAFEIDSNGVNNQPIISHGKHHDYDSIFFYGGRIKISHDGNYLANVGCTLYSTLIHKFDNQSGKVDTTLSLNYIEPFGWPISLEFSPSNNLIYLSTESTLGSFIYQFDLNSSNFNASKVVIGQDPVNNNIAFMDVQLGPDRKIYCPNIGSNYVSMIKYPDLKGDACDFILRAIVFDSITVPPYNTKGNLIGCAPQIIPFFFKPDFIYRHTCLKDVIEFHIQTSNYESVVWKFGDTLSGLNNISYENNPIHIFSNPGNYDVELIVYYSGYTETVKKTVAIHNIDFTLGQSPQILCGDTSITLNINVQDCNFLWQDGSNSSSIVVSEAGVYWVEVSNQFCTKSDEIEIITSVSPTDFSIGMDTIICDDVTLLLTAPEGDFKYTWNDGSYTQQILLDEAGMFFVSVSNLCGSKSDTIIVNEENCNCKPYFPNAFTPNNDGLNDIFMPISECKFDLFKFKVFNRWGTMMFETNEPNVGWNGSFQNEKASVGLYVYSLIYKIAYSNKIRNITGTVQLLQSR